MKSNSNPGRRQGKTLEHSSVAQFHLRHYFLQGSAWSSQRSETGLLCPGFAWNFILDVLFLLKKWGVGDIEESI
jgi:hypothetical protein